MGKGWGDGKGKPAQPGGCRKPAEAFLGLAVLAAGTWLVLRKGAR
jgi:hypothetical protein